MLSHRFLLGILSRISIRSKCTSTKMSNKIAVCQMTSIADKQANLKVVSEIITNAAKENVKMVFLPEACDFICDNKKDMLANAESIIGGSTVDKYRALAKTNDVWLSIGGVHEKDEKNPSKVYNTHLIIDNKGAIVQTYRKLHLFDVEIPEKSVRLKESDFTSPGENIVTPVQTPVGRIGLAICYDMRFPELSVQLAYLGAEILTFPSAFTQATGEAHWEVLLRARAIESQCYVVAAAQCGAHSPRRSSYGHAACVDPWGRILAECAPEAGGYRVAELSMERLAEVRRGMPVFRHRRKDVYSLYSPSLRNKLLPEHDESPSSDMSSNPTSDMSSNMPEVRRFGHVTVPETCVFYTTPHTFAFVNLRCVTPGHVLVAPNRCAERNENLTAEEAADFFNTIRLVQKVSEAAHGARSCTVTIQDGVDAGQTVKHLHCHIMPRKKGDFIENDHIYLELAKHDHLMMGHPGKPARSLQVMEEEASMLREKISEMGL